MPTDLLSTGKDVEIDDPQRKQKGRTIMANFQQLLQSWKGSKEFGLAQAQVALILTLAWLGNNFPKSYPRNDNHNLPMFYAMNVAFVIAGFFTLHHDAQGSSRGVQLLSRPQTEEWKGWMQWAFIMVGANQLIDSLTMTFRRCRIHRSTHELLFD